MAALTNVRPDGDDTTHANIDNSAGGQSPLWSYIDDEPDGVSADYIQNDTAETDGTVILTLGAYPADLYRIQTLTVIVDVQAVSFSDDTCSVTAQIKLSDGTALTDAVEIASEADTTRTQRTVTFTLNATGRNATQAQWNDAEITLAWDYTLSGGGDNGQVRLFAAEIGGTYASDGEYMAWLEDQEAARIVLVEPTAYDPSTEAEVMYYLASATYHSGALDAPANQPYDDRLIGDPVITESMETAFGGRSRTSVGNVAINNADNYFTDATRDWLAKTWEGRRFVILHGAPTWDRADFRPLFTGVATQLNVEEDLTLSFDIQDRSYLLNVPIGGRPFLHMQNAGQLMPLTFGKCSNVEGILYSLDGESFIFNDGETNGVPEDVAYWLDGVDGTIAAFEHQPAPGASNFNNENVTERLTADIQGMEDENTYFTKAADIIKYLLLNFTELTLADLDTAAFTALNTDCPYPIGLHIRTERNLMEIIDEIMGDECVLGLWGWTPDGKFTLKQYKDVSGAASYSLTDRNIFGPITVSEQGRPQLSVKLGFDKNWTPQTYLPSTADNKRKTFVYYGREDDRKRSLRPRGFPLGGFARNDPFLRYNYSKEHTNIAVARNNAIRILHPSAADGEVVPTLITNESDANTEAIRRLPLFGSKRKVYRVQADARLMAAALHDVVNITSARLNLASGQDTRLISIERYLLSHRCQARLIGPAQTFPTTDVVVRCIQGFCKTGSTGTQDFTNTNVGNKTPKAALFWGSGADALNDGDYSHEKFFIGACDASNEWSTSHRNENNVATTDTKQTHQTDKCVAFINDTASNIEAEANLDSFINNGVRLNFTTVGQGHAIQGLVFAGDDVQANCGTVAGQNATTGINTTCGFIPDLIFFARAGANQTFDSGIQNDMKPGLFVAIRIAGTKRYQVATVTYNRTNGAGSQLMAAYHLTSIINKRDSLTTTYGHYYVSATSDGFRIYHTGDTNDGGAFGYLALKLPGRAINMRLFYPNQSGSQNVYFGFQPQAVLAWGNYSETVGSAGLAWFAEPFSMGAADKDGGKDGACYGWSDWGAATTITRSRADDAYIFRIYNYEISDNVYYNVTSFINGGITVNVGAASSASYDIHSFLLGIE